MRPFQPYFTQSIVCPNEAPRPDDNVIAYIHLLEIIIFRTTGPIKKKQPWPKIIHLLTNKKYSILKKEIIFFLINVMEISIFY